MSAARSTTAASRSTQATFLAVAIIVAGIVPRWSMIDRFYLDFDESMHFQAAKEATLVDTFWSSRAYTHPPLVFLLYHLWLPLGDSERVLRLPALLFGVAALWIAYLWLRQMTDDWAALAGLVLLTFALPMIHLSIQMRGYMLLLLLIFSGLYFRERSLTTGSVGFLLAETLCLALAMLVHYATAWVLLALGILTLVQISAGGLHHRYVASWAASQVVLGAIAGVLLISHAMEFQGTRTQHELWSNWLMDVPFQSGQLLAVKAALWKLLRLLNYVAGCWWPVLLIALMVGTVSLYDTSCRGNQSLTQALGRSGLVALPVLLAMVLFAFQIYPLGGTRHSLWLMPFLTLGFTAGVRPLLNSSSRWKNVVAIVPLALWTADVPFREIVAVKQKNDDSPEKLQAFAQLLRDTISPGELLLVDDSTRNVLDYYLSRKTVNHGRDLGRGYRQYNFDGYRVIALPDFHFYYANLSDPATRLTELLGDDAQRPFWIVYLGYGLPQMKLRTLAKQLPPGKLLERHSLPELDNEILRVQMVAPTESSAQTTNLTAPVSDFMQRDGT